MISSMDATLGGNQGATCTAECALSYLGLLRETGVEILNGSRPNVCTRWAAGGIHAPEPSVDILGYYSSSAKSQCPSHGYRD